MGHQDVLTASGQARLAILRGAGRAAAALKATLGPLPRKAIVNRKQGGALLSSDARAIVQELEFKDPFENIGAQMMRGVVNRMDVLAGGACATGAILAYAMFREGIHQLSSGAQPALTIRGMRDALPLVSTEIRKLSRPVSSDIIAQVATVAADNDSAIGTVIAEAMKMVGPGGAILVEESKSMRTELAMAAGMKLDGGYLSPSFVTDAGRMECVLEDSFILICEKRIVNMRDLLPVLEQVARAGRPLLVMAEEVDGEALATLVVNKLRETLKAAAVRAPDSGGQLRAILEDIAALTGAKPFLEGSKLEAARLEDLGRARRVVLDEDTTTIVAGAGQSSAIAARIDQLRSLVGKARTEGEREQLQGRLAKLTAGVAIVRAGGGATESEMKEKKTRLDGALRLTRSAVEDGGVPGGGIALLRASGALRAIAGDANAGAAIVARACEEPFRAMAAAAGWEEEAAVGAAAGNSTPGYGLNVLTGEWQDLFAAGIIDSAKVVRLALEVAAAESVAYLSGETAAFEA